MVYETDVYIAASLLVLINKKVADHGRENLWSWKDSAVKDEAEAESYVVNACRSSFGRASRQACHLNLRTTLVWPWA